MPPKRAVKALKSTEECTLQFGKHGNIIKLREHMQTIVTGLYGIVGMFFTTRVRYELILQGWPFRFVIGDFGI